MPPQFVDRPVDDDALQPRAKRARLVEAVERGKRPLNGVLRHVVGRCPFGRNGTCGLPRLGPVAIEELTGCDCRAVADQLDQPRI